MPDLSWYARRLRAMGPAEILHRAAQSARHAAWRHRAGRSAARGPVRAPSSLQASRVAPAADAAEIRAVVEEADSLLRHAWNFLGLERAAEPAIDWHRDPASGITAPRRFAFDIDHRDERLCGNIKNTWEKNRHQHITLLALAFALTGDERYAAEAAAQVREWMAQNPVLVGVNWTHPLEHGLRLIAWVWSERLLRGSRAHAALFGDGSEFWRCVEEHQWFIARAYSRGSSANNHVIGEMAGLFAAACAWPVLRRSQRDRKLAQRVLEAELARQAFASGLNREQAFGYHLFVLELGLVAAYEGQRAGKPLSAECLATLRRMAEAVPALADVAGNLPNFGDADDALAVQLQARAAPRVPWLMQGAQALTGAAVRAPERPTLPARCLGLCPPQPAEPAEPPRAFADAGLYVLASGRGTAEEVFVLADAGPLGYLATAAHGHADALHFTLSAGGVPLLVDPGTYCYHTDPPWRRYFRGTSAHNTVTVDGSDQSEQGGAFLWTRKATAWAERWEPAPEGGVWAGGHEGYRPLGVSHRRVLQLDGRRLAVEDELTGTGLHRVSLRFHCAPECDVRQTAEREITVRRAGWTLRLKLPDALNLRLIRGGEDGGWYSPRFGVKIPCTTVEAAAECRLPAAYQSLLVIGRLG